MKEILDILRDLKINRNLSTEADKLFEPFIGKSGELSFSLMEVSTTFSTRHGEFYKGGKTILAKITDTDLMCTILFSKEENDWITNLTSGEEFTCRVKVLQLDKLYNRVVFGEVFENYEIEPAKSQLATTFSPEEIEDFSAKEEIQQNSDRLEWSEDLKRERFRLLSLLTKTVQRKPPIFAARYPGNIREADSEEDENTHFEEEAIYSEDEIKRKVYRFFFGLFIMFCSFTGFMSENYTFSFISFCFGIYLFLPPLKKLKDDYKRDKSGKYNLLLAFVSLAISFSVENKVVHILFFCLAGGILFFFFKKKLRENLEKY